MAFAWDHIAPDQQRAGAVAAAAAIALIGAIAALNATDVAALWAAWRSSEAYSHGVVVAAVIPWLVWRERGQLAWQPSAPWLVGAALLVSLETAWAFAYGAHADVVRYALLPCLAWAAVLLLLGASSARQLLFPLAWFWCAVALWDGLTGPLQHLSAVVVARVLDAIGVPTVRSGNVISVPVGSFEILPACSGLSFLIVAVSLGSLLGYLRRWRLVARLVVAAAAALVALVSNWLRIAITIETGQLTNMQSSLVTDEHIQFGWWVFAVGLVVFLVVALRWHPGSIAARDRSRPTLPGLKSAGTRAATVVVLLAVGPLWVSWQQRAPDTLPIELLLPAARGGWHGPEAAAALWAPSFSGASADARGQYSSADTSVIVDLTYYATQRRNAKLLGYPSKPEGPDGAQVVYSTLVRRGSATGGPPSLREAVVDLAGGQRWLVWQWYQAGSLATGSTLEFRLVEGWRGLEGKSGAAAVSVAVACTGDCEDGRARAALGNFMMAMESDLMAAGDPQRSAARELRTAG